MKESKMFETIDKMFLAGLGAMSMTKEHAEKIFDEYVARGKVEKEQKQGFVKDIMEHAKKTKEDLEKVVSEQVKKGMSSLAVATKDDVKRLEEKLDQLLKKG
jgi:poly(hydroxyalkanoate) granule-associated protein